MKWLAEIAEKAGIPVEWAPVPASFSYDQARLYARSDDEQK
jgi:hypothetical protein